MVLVLLVVVFNYLLVIQCYTEDVFCQQRLSGQNQHRAWARYCNPGNNGQKTSGNYRELITHTKTTELYVYV